MRPQELKKLKAKQKDLMAILPRRIAALEKKLKKGFLKGVLVEESEEDDGNQSEEL